MAKEKLTVNEMRLRALAMLKKAKELERAEKQEKVLKLGELINRFLDHSITAHQMKTEVQNLTGKQWFEEAPQAVEVAEQEEN